MLPGSQRRRGPCPAPLCPARDDRLLRAGKNGVLCLRPAVRGEMHQREPRARSLTYRCRQPRKPTAWADSAVQQARQDENSGPCIPKLFANLQTPVSRSSRIIQVLVRCGVAWGRRGGGGKPPLSPAQGALLASARHPSTHHSLACGSGLGPGDHSCHPPRASWAEEEREVSHPPPCKGVGRSWLWGLGWLSFPGGSSAEKHILCFQSNRPWASGGPGAG